MCMRVVLYQTEIAGNFGAVLRTASAFGAAVEAIEPLGFPLDAKALRRAAMDYRSGVDVTRHRDWSSYAESYPEVRRVLMTTRGDVELQEFAFRAGDHLVFGKEGSGAPELVHEAADARVRVPMRGRSLNLSVAVGVCLWEGLRQIGGLGT